LIKILLAVNICLTTNFDKSIENAYDFLNYIAKHFSSKNYYVNLIKKYIPQLEEYPNSKHDKVIYYLHADVENEVFILRKNQYDKYYPSVSGLNNYSKCIENCFRFFYKNKNIIFIGFSFADRYVREYIFKLSKELKNENLLHQSIYSEEGKIFYPKQSSHFMLIDTNTDIWLKEKSNIFKKFEEYNIFPIIYQSGLHIFIEQLFEYLSREKINEN
ncbi:MAG: SIR2 family protein, partial [Promethearchaeota archaeon]